MVFAKADGSVLSSYHSGTKSATNLNDNTELTLSNQTIGGLLFWQDGEDQKAVVLNTAGYSFANQATRPIDQPDLHYTLHYHNEALASHKPAAILDAEISSLNTFLNEQKDIEQEITAALPTDKKLCHFKVAKQSYKGAEVDVHFALTTDGWLYFYQDGASGLESLTNQPPAQLTDSVNATTPIADCHKTGFAVESDAGVLVWLADTQKLYGVDNHQQDYHLHEVMDLADYIGAGKSADYMVAIGEGAGVDHNH